MAKEEWILIAIGIFGVFLLVLAIMAIPEAIGGIYAYWQISIAVQYTSTLSPVVEATQKAALAGGIKAVTSVLVFVPFFYYFIRHGKWLHKIGST